MDVAAGDLQTAMSERCTDQRQRRVVVECVSGVSVAEPVRRKLIGDPGLLGQPLDDRLGSLTADWEDPIFRRGIAFDLVKQRE